MDWPAEFSWVPILPCALIQLSNSFILFMFLLENLGAWHLGEGQVVARTMNPVDIETLDQPTYNQVLADISTTFTLLVGIYFPSVTGMKTLYSDLC